MPYSKFYKELLDSFLKKEISPEKFVEAYKPSKNLTLSGLMGKFFKGKPCDRDMCDLIYTSIQSGFFNGDHTHSESSCEYQIKKQ